MPGRRRPAAPRPHRTSPAGQSPLDGDDIAGPLAKNREASARSAGEEEPGRDPGRSAWKRGHERSRSMTTIRETTPEDIAWYAIPTQDAARRLSVVPDRGLEAYGAGGGGAGAGAHGAA